MKISHVGLSVSNVERAVQFYIDHFGMELATPIFDFGGVQIEDIQDLPGARGRLGVVRKDGVMLELFEYASPHPAEKDPDYPVSDHGISHFGIDVDEIEAVVERMRAGGVRFHSPVHVFPSGMRAAYGRDLDGNVFELLEMGPPPIVE